MTELLRVEDLSYVYRQSTGWFRPKQNVMAVNNVSFSLVAGETLGLVGESGCGKSTLGRVLLNLLPNSGGRVFFEDQRIDDLSYRQMRPLRQKMQMVFQDPMESFNARHTIEMILEEPLEIHQIGSKHQRRERVRYLLNRVGLSDALLTRYPHELSGGQRQRVALARALALSPKLLICDESVSALDVSVQAQILNLLLDLQKEFQLAILFISHDLSVVRHISDRIAVMYLGRWIEVGQADMVSQQALHPYTQALFSAVPIRSPRLRSSSAFSPIKGELPSAMDPPFGCYFHPRCPYATEKCRTISPELSSGSHLVACHYPLIHEEQITVNQ